MRGLWASRPKTLRLPNGRLWPTGCRGAARLRCPVPVLPELPVLLRPVLRGTTFILQLQPALIWRSSRSSGLSGWAWRLQARSPLSCSALVAESCAPGHGQRTSARRLTALRMAWQALTLSYTKTGYGHVSCFKRAQKTKEKRRSVWRGGPARNNGRVCKLLPAP